MPSSSSVAEPATATSIPRWYPPRKSLSWGADIMILSRRNETLKAIRGLRRKQGDHVLLEGPDLIEAAVGAAIALDSVLMTPQFAAGDEGRRIAARLARPTLTVTEELLDELADADSPRGVLAVARLPRPGVEAV